LFSIFFFARARNHDFMPKKGARLAVQKTYKLFIGGKFLRGENGRVIPAKDANGKALANYCRASRKDFRDAVTAARSALGTWSKNSAYLRGQILYRAAEMLEMRRRGLEEELSRSNGPRPATAAATARREVTAAIDRLVYYAGWTDKFAQILGSVNPVASSHFNFTIPEPTGVVVAVCPDSPALLGLVSIVAPIVAGGNCVVALASPANALPALTFSEIIATSDFPAGVINILAGERAELAPHFASHMDVNAIVDASGDEKIGTELQSGTAINLKRYHRRSDVDYFRADAENPYWIIDTTEMKTAWHPIGL
jgi:acyl-CoA reductase-like NAD-dependent aldehyde dehydrogenase